MTPIESDPPSETLSAAAASSLPKRAIWAFVSPGRLFEELRIQTGPGSKGGHFRTIGALLLGAVLIAAGNVLIPVELWQQVIREQLLETGQELPDDLGATVAFARWAAAIGPLVFWPVLGTLIAGIYWLVFVAGLGYEGTFPRYLAVTSHAILVGAVGALALTPLRIYTQDVDLMLTPLAFLPTLEAGFLFRMFRYLDLFNLWASALVGFGASVIDGARGAVASVGVALATSLLIAVLLTAFIP